MSEKTLKFVGWIKGSVEYKGRASARKLTTLVAFVALCAMLIVHLNTGNLIQVEFIYVFALMPVIGLGYMTAQNIVDIFKRGDSVYADQVYDIGNRNKPTAGDITTEDG